MFNHKQIIQGALALLILSQFLFWGLAPAYAQGETPPPPRKTPSPEKTPTELPEAERLGQRTAAPIQVPPTAKLPDLRMLPIEPARLDTSRGGGSRLLRFSARIINAGVGPAELRGERVAGSEDFTVTQQIYVGEKETASVPLVGTFYYNSSHSHYHWEGFAAYEVWTVETNGNLVRRVAANDKVGFCLFDSYRAGSAWLEENVTQELPIPGNQIYGKCQFTRQGLSPGWVDVYRLNLDGQALDVSHLADGVYALRATVNPHNVLYESNRNNNSAVLYFALHENRLILIGPQFDMVTYFSHLVDHGIVDVVDGKVQPPSPGP